MRLEKWGFLLSYAVYLMFCIFFSLISKNEAAINSMIFAITIASTAFSISDLVFTKISIDKKENDSISGLYYLSGYARKFYINKIKIKYGKKVEEMGSLLMELFEGDEDKITRLFEGNLSTEEKENIMFKIGNHSDEEFTEFIRGFVNSDISDIKEVLSDDDEDNSIDFLLNKQKKKDKINVWIASSVAVIGLIALLIILTIRYEAKLYINNALTVLAFFSVIVNLILKEYYRANSINKIEREKKELLEELRVDNENGD